jgi:hypothetical protein
MRVRTDNYISRPGKMLGYQLMTHPITHITNAASSFTGKAAQKYMIIRKLPGRARSSMVKENYRPLWLSYILEAALSELPYS